ncbi:hypothetical protein VTK73DRAFT_8535 [Phialemonium thermophilum]|uniref:Uncharacterized protein n=1 Tax=Phialemonium thermophilum TaxID=223376 RepID=A0ABR3W8J9_9PEZI
MDIGCSHHSTGHCYEVLSHLEGYLPLLHLESECRTHYLGCSVTLLGSLESTFNVRSVWLIALEPLQAAYALFLANTCNLPVVPGVGRVRGPRYLPPPAKGFKGGMRLPSILSTLVPLSSPTPNGETGSFPTPHRPCVVRSLAHGSHPRATLLLEVRSEPPSRPPNSEIEERHS